MRWLEPILLQVWADRKIVTESCVSWNLWAVRLPCPDSNREVTYLGSNSKKREMKGTEDISQDVFADSKSCY